MEMGDWIQKIFLFQDFREMAFWILKNLPIETETTNMMLVSRMKIWDLTIKVEQTISARETGNLTKKISVLTA